MGGWIYVAGHNRTHGGPFHAVASARRGDLVVVSTPYATARYTVIDRRQESERNVALLRPGRRELLRLQTSTDPAEPPPLDRRRAPRGADTDLADGDRCRSHRAAAGGSMWQRSAASGARAAPARGGGHAMLDLPLMPGAMRRPGAGGGGQQRVAARDGLRA